MAAPVKKTVELFYDVVSPYSWIAFEVLTRYQNKWNIDLKLKPFFLGGIMQGSGNKPPAMVPNKGAYMLHDIERLKQYYNVPMNQPSDFAEVAFKKGSINAQRFLTAVSMSNPDMVEPVTRELWMRVWNKDEDIYLPESFIQAGVKAGLSMENAKAAVAKIKDSEVKDKVKERTQEALDKGAFGSPIIIAHVDGKEHLIFGSDRFPILAMILGEKWEGPLVEFSKCKL
ncbi:unnamed protein product [Owenia fusiformis]|uniref:Glutathione S-transferase kappa n=1 Tax=Owenia fusiformis TaxID=6347 RepID=A0A8S4N2P2_OWEFU|nr:unnamed protein product [Owenia fusiformis]